MPTTAGKFKRSSNGKLLLTTIIGDAQVAGIDVDLFDPVSKQSTNVYNGAPAHNLVLQHSEQFASQILLITAVVKDVQAATDWTSVTLVLVESASGATPVTYATPPTKAAPGGKVSHTFVVSLEEA